METNDIVERLTFQVDSFREGFEILSSSRDFKEMTKTFAHLLRGSFSLKELYILHKNSVSDDWIPLGFGSMPDEYSVSLLKNYSDSVTYYPGKKISTSIAYSLADNTILGILIGSKLDGKELSDYDKVTLQVLLQVFDNAYKAYLNHQKEKKLIFELREKVFQLNNLIDTGIEISKLGQRDYLYELTLERICSLTNASSALLEINNPDNPDKNELYIFPAESKLEEIKASSHKVQTEFIFNTLCFTITLSAKEIRGGVTAFTELDKLLLDAVSRQLYVSIENEFLHIEALEKERIEKELHLAASIQQQIIPKELPKLKGYDIAGINIPTKEVGGDYYDCIKLTNGNYAFIIADVAGKGIASALLVNALNAALYSYLDFDLPLPLMVGKLNKLIYNVTPADKFITFFIAILKEDTAELEIVNAGHNPILLLRKNGEIEKIEAGGLGLGMLDFGLPYSEQKLKLSSGDRLFLYTDGIPEAMNAASEEYSDEKMINFLFMHSEESSKELTTNMIKDITSHTKGTSQSDDITLLYLRKL